MNEILQKVSARFAPLVTKHGMANVLAGLALAAAKGGNDDLTARLLDLDWQIRNPSRKQQVP